MKEKPSPNITAKLHLYKSMCDILFKDDEFMDYFKLNICSTYFRNNSEIITKHLKDLENEQTKS